MYQVIQQLFERFSIIFRGYWRIFGKFWVDVLHIVGLLNLKLNFERECLYFILLTNAFKQFGRGFITCPLFAFIFYTPLSLDYRQLASTVYYFYFHRAIIVIVTTVIFSSKLTVSLNRLFLFFIKTNIIIIKIVDVFLIETNILN